MLPRLRSGSYSAALRRELSARNVALAKAGGMPCVESYGSCPVVVYEPYADEARHGNFADQSYAEILSNPSWCKRLQKVHSQAKQALPKRERRWMELDSSTSSDALLMNVFCYPGVPGAAAGMLGLGEVAVPEFGFKARVPLSNGHADRTEVDMRLGDLLVESKLTENDFQQKDVAVVESYRDFREVFERRELPREKKKYRSYQLIRNVLAAHAMRCSFCVFLDVRRPDLLEEWYAVMRSVKTPELKTRCKVLTWQEMSEALPEPLQKFLDAKYGIVSPGREPSPVPGADGASGTE